MGSDSELKVSPALLRFCNRGRNGDQPGPVLWMPLRVTPETAATRASQPLVSFPSPLLFLTQGTQCGPNSCAPAPEPVLWSPWRAGPSPTARPPARRRPSGLLSQQKPEPTGLSLKPEDADSGSKSQEPPPQYSPVLKKEQPAAPTQKEGAGEPKEVQQEGPRGGRACRGRLGLASRPLSSCSPSPRSRPGPSLPCGPSRSCPPKSTRAPPRDRAQPRPPSPPCPSTRSLTSP